jgi:hypothetical protein
MPVYLITYDVNTLDKSEAEKTKADQRRNKIRDNITEGYKEHQRLSESTYAVVTTDSPARVSRRLFGLIEKQDEYHVALLQTPVESHASEGTKAWLREHIP